MSKPAPKRVIVIGSGIVGASLAWYLARAGAEVRVLEANADFGGIATPQSWAWINASWGNIKPYYELRHFSMGEWRAFAKAVPGLKVNWTGSLLWDLSEEKLRAFVQEHQGWGYNIRLVDGQEAKKLEPGLAEFPALAAHAQEEASIEPLEAAIAIMNDARRLGADFIPNARVKWLREGGGQIDGVMTSEGSFDADEVIVAAGTGCNEILKSIGLSIGLQAPPGLLIHTEPQPDILNGLVIAPAMHVRQTSSGRLIAGTDFEYEGMLQNPQEVASAMLKDVSKILKTKITPSLERFTFAQRPMPLDGHPCLGRIGSSKGLYLAVTHSGVTLAPAIGSLCGQEIISGERNSLLNPYAPDRLVRPSD